MSVVSLFVVCRGFGVLYIYEHSDSLIVFFEVGFSHWDS